jgi:hypothetical protein
MYNNRIYIYLISICCWWLINNIVKLVPDKTHAYESAIIQTSRPINNNFYTYTYLRIEDSVEVYNLPNFLGMK